MIVSDEWVWRNMPCGSREYLEVDGGGAQMCKVTALFEGRWELARCISAINRHDELRVSSYGLSVSAEWTRIPGREYIG